MNALLAHVVAGKHLGRSQAREAFERIMAGSVDEPTLGAFLCALATKGEHVDELVGAAEAMRAAATPVRCDDPCLDTCGTGGDGISTFNVSTTAAIIAAAAGAVVAKHGNRTNTRVSGSAEVLAELGVNIAADAPVLERCLAEIGLAFLYAPGLHPAMKHAVGVRRAIRGRTIFNLLGPLANPAGAKYQVLGVSRPEHLELIARALRDLEADRVWVVHGAGGLCDLTITGPTQVCELRNGRLIFLTIDPADARLPRAPLSALLVGSAKESAQILRAVLQGESGPWRDHALLNAGAALVVYGASQELAEGVRLAAQTVDSGAALAKLDDLVRLSNS